MSPPFFRRRSAASLAATFVGLAAVCSVADAQGRRVASPSGRSATEIGGTYDDSGRYVGGKWIEILYGRPIRRGRSPFGPPNFFRILNDGAPVWRAGANVSTRLRTEVPLVVGETTLEPGEYTVFIDLLPGQWTLILSTWPAQTTYDQNDRNRLWGAYHYMAHKDVARVPMTLRRMPYSFDQLSWQFLDVNHSGGKLSILWDDWIAWVSFELAEP